MGPLLFVNFLSSIIAYILYQPTDEYRIYIINNPYASRFFEVFLRAIAYLSSLAILGNTIMSPILEFMSLQYGTTMQSDFSWAWNISLNMSNEIYYLSEYTVWILFMILLFLIILMTKSNYKAKNIEIALCILLGFSIVFFFAGISDQNLFQWLIISSVTLEIIFSFVYVLRFGRRIE
jgi:hypothetical protein